MAAARTEPRLQVWRTVAQAYALTFRNFSYLLRISWAWVLLMIPISFAFHSFMFLRGWHDSTRVSYFGSLFYNVSSTLLFLPFLASIAVAWHRRLLADDVWPRRVYLRLDRTVVGYLGLSALISFLFEGPMTLMPTGNLFEVIKEAGWSGWLLLGVVLTTVAGLVLSTKIWLALPARALERREITIRQAWTGSHRNVLRLILGSVLCSLPIFVLLLIFIIIFNLDWTNENQIILFATYQTLSEFGITFLAGIPVISFLSLAYRDLIEDSTTLRSHDP